METELDNPAPKVYQSDIVARDLVLEENDEREGFDNLEIFELIRSIKVHNIFDIIPSTIRIAYCDPSSI